MIASLSATGGPPSRKSRRLAGRAIRACTTPGRMARFRGGWAINGRRDHVLDSSAHVAAECQRTGPYPDDPGQPEGGRMTTDYRDPWTERREVRKADHEAGKHRPWEYVHGCPPCEADHRRHAGLEEFVAFCAECEAAEAELEEAMKREHATRVADERKAARVRVAWLRDNPTPSPGAARAAGRSLPAMAPTRGRDPCTSAEGAARGTTAKAPPMAHRTDARTAAISARNSRSLPARNAARGSSSPSVGRPSTFKSSIASRRPR